MTTDTFELPPLPEALGDLAYVSVAPRQMARQYTADQMREYARQAVLMERNKCAMDVASKAKTWCDDPEYWLRELAAAIRNQP